MFDIDWLQQLAPFFPRYGEQGDSTSPVFFNYVHVVNVDFTYSLFKIFQIGIVKN